ncbi:MAG: cryptochrome/photolyase family protein [Polyangiales bacterium]
MTFAEAIRRARPAAHEVAARRWVYVPYDQLTTAVGPLAGADPAAVGVVMVESAARARARPYHQRKLALVLANERHFALELAARGFRVLYLAGEAGFGAQLRAAMARHGIARLTAMEPAERCLREELRAEGVALDLAPNATWLTGPEDFAAALPAPPYRMDAFYRHVRRRTGVLMAGGKPLGGRFSFDGENRERWRGDPPAPPRFGVAPDDLTREVIDLVRARFGDHPGDLAGFDLPTREADAAALWAHARARALPHFGPFEDAMSAAHPRLFHAAVSPLVNLGRLLPRRLVDDVVGDHAAGRVGLASAEGFVRQVLGWREFVRHVHRATDGFRAVDPGGAPDRLGATAPLPPAYWGGAPSGLRCLDVVVADVVREGWSHHITRLMVLSNVATLLGVSPRALTDWFWAMYTDAFDWVVEPNVLGMGTYAVGDLMTTKPYVSGAAYLAKMGDACAGCRFDPSGRDAARPCPLTPLYWDFLDRAALALAGNERMKLPLASARRRPDAQRANDRRVRLRVLDALGRGEALAADVASPTRG